MWEKFTSSLGKVVQDLLNIFKKKNKTQDWDCVTFTTGEGTCDEIHLGPGKVTIAPLAELPVQITWEKELKPCKPERGKRAELPLFEDGISEEEFKALENLFSIYLTDLPKRHWVKTLIVSCYASFDYDSIGADISQLDETGIAHFWCTSTKSMSEWDEDLRQRHILEEPLEIDAEEEHVIVNDAILEEWPNGYWTWRTEE